jgi:hypothetical protein
MSPLKKALQQRSNEKEFYAQGFLSQPLYKKWQQTVKPHCVDEFALLVQADHGDDERLAGLLKKHPMLVKVILHPMILKQIKPWYQQHVSAHFKRQKRQQESLIDTLYILCARYKKQLRGLILKSSNGLIGISCEDWGTADEKSQSLDTSHLHVTAAQNQTLNRALQHYQAITKLQKTLEGDDFAAKKLRDFRTVFQHASVQAALRKRPPAWVTQLFQKFTAFCQFEHWLESTGPTAHEAEIAAENNLILTELTQHIKKIPHYTY